MAVEAVKKKAAKELQVALRKLREDLELDKKLALQTQKEVIFADLPYSTPKRQGHT